MTDRSIRPPITPDQLQEPRWARFLFASTTAAWLWLVIRLYAHAAGIAGGENWGGLRGSNP